jgi:hypothetical protein
VKSILFWAGVLAALPAAAQSASPAVGEAPAGKPRVENLAVELGTGNVVVSFRVADAVTEETLERVHSGIPVTFRHRIEFMAPRGFPLLPARTLLGVTVETRADYDSLTRRYSLYRTVRIPGQRNPSPQRSVGRTVEDMRSWMTEVDRLRIDDPRFPFEGLNVKVRIQSSLGRKYVLLIFPGNRSAKAEWRPEP